MGSANGGLRIVLLLVSGMVAAALIAPIAGASAGRPPDVRDAAAGIFERFAAAHPYGAGLAAADIFERFAAAHPYGVGLAGAPVTPPDVRDAAAASRMPALSTASSFHWSEYGAGIGTGIGSALILAGLCFLGVAIVRRNRVSLA